MLAVPQDVMEVPGGSATGLLPSTSTPLLHQQPSENAPVLQVDILPKAQVRSSATRLEGSCDALTLAAVM